MPVFNAPFSNTRSVAELVIGEIVMLLRRVVPRSVAAHAGRWDKSAVNSHEVRGKTLGIVGYGNIGSQLSYLAEALGMRVVFYDHTDKLRHGNTEPTASLRELLAQSDVVSLHVPETPATAGMIGVAEIAAMKPGAYLINNSRGTVVDLDALAAALREGRLRGAAIDVFPVEPSSNAEQFHSPLQGLDNVILTPHVGGSTEEAQERIGVEVARKLVEYSDGGSTMGAVNFPQVQLPIRPHGTRFIQVQRNLPGMLGKLNDLFARHAVNIAAQYYETDSRRRLRGAGRRRFRGRQPARSHRYPRARRHHPRPAGVRTQSLNRGQGQRRSLQNAPRQQACDSMPFDIARAREFCLKDRRATARDRQERMASADNDNKDPDNKNPTQAPLPISASRARRAWSTSRKRRRRAASRSRRGASAWPRPRSRPSSRATPRKAT